jgi:aspartate/methionine/tyrosine aminotransferase
MLFRGLPRRAPRACWRSRRDIGADPERVLAFHSLSKRSNLAGLRSGFVAGGPQAIARIRQLRNYAGAPLPLPLQHVAARAWADESHVEASRALYQQKYRIADEVLGHVPATGPPRPGFFLWLPVPDGEEAALRLWREGGVRVLPGAYLAKDAGPATRARAISAWRSSRAPRRSAAASAYPRRALPQEA